MHEASTTPGRREFGARPTYYVPYTGEYVSAITLLASVRYNCRMSCNRSEPKTCNSGGCWDSLNDVADDVTFLTTRGPCTGPSPIVTSATRAKVLIMVGSR